MSANDMDLDTPLANAEDNSINTPPQSAGHTPQRPTAFGRVDSGTTATASYQTRAADSAAPESPNLDEVADYYDDDGDDMAMEYEDSRVYQRQRRGRGGRGHRGINDLSQMVHEEFPNNFGDDWHITH